MRKQFCILITSEHVQLNHKNTHTHKPHTQTHIHKLTHKSNILLLIWKYRVLGAGYPYSSNLSSTPHQTQNPFFVFEFVDFSCRKNAHEKRKYKQMRMKSYMRIREEVSFDKQAVLPKIYWKIYISQTYCPQFNKKKYGYTFQMMAFSFT